MSSWPGLNARMSAYPWTLYSAAHLSDREREGLTGFNSGMLREDLSNLHYSYEVRLAYKGAEADAGNRLLAHLLDDFNHQGYERDPLHLIFALVPILLEESLASDGVYLEPFADPPDGIMQKRRTAWNRRDVSDIDSPALGYIPGWSVRHSGRGLRQVSPEPGAPEVHVPASRVRTVEMPPSLRRRWRRIATQLAEVDEAKLITGGLEKMGWVGYEFAEHAKAEKLLVAAVTTDIGWDARGLFGEYVTPHYTAYRRLRFHAFWLEVVRSVVDSINTITSDRSIMAAAAFAFDLEGLPAPSRFTDAMSDLQAGKVSISAATDELLAPRYARST